MFIAVDTIIMNRFTFCLPLLRADIYSYYRLDVLYVFILLWLLEEGIHHRVQQKVDLYMLYVEQILRIKGIKVETSFIFPK